MAVNTITYANKVTLNENADIDAVNKCQASDMNEIKSVVNNNANELSQAIATTTPTSLYADVSGTSGDVTLSDSAANYDYFEIYYKDRDGNYSFLKVDTPNGKTVSLMTSSVGGSGTITYYSKNMDISGTSISNTANLGFIRTFNGNAFGSYNNDSSYILITKVLGFN